MSKLILMQGLPASGKSTLAEVMHRASGNAVRINKDLLRTMLHFDKWTGKNELFTKYASQELARLFLGQNKTVIIDDTNLNPRTIESWKALAKTAEAGFEIERVETPYQVCLERDQKRENPVGHFVILDMAMQYGFVDDVKKVVVCDLDGTLADISHRLYHVQGEKPDWEAFFRGIPLDTFREDIWLKVKEAASAHDAKIVFVSGRNKQYLFSTIMWLKARGLVYGEDYFTILMRGEHDRRPDTEVKKDILDRYLKHFEIVRVFDDRPSVIRMWRENGLEVVDCGDGVEF